MSEKPNLTDKPFKCRHCHAKGYMRILDSANYEHEYEVDTEHSNYFQPSGYYETWQICRCANCDNDNVVFSIWDENREDFHTKPHIIHPESIAYSAPKAIGNQFRAAIESMHVSPSGAVNQFRVVIEMIWADKNGWSEKDDESKKPNLRGDSGMIKQLVDSGVLAGDYAEMADLLAVVGNKGSHLDDVKVTKEDAEMARELCTVILEHVYELHPKGLGLVEKLAKKFRRENGWRNGNYVDRTNW